MNSVNSVDKIITPAMVVQCGHAPGAEVYWEQETPQRPPTMLFRNFPANGRICLARKTVILACPACSKDIDVILAEYQKSLTL